VAISIPPMSCPTTALYDSTRPSYFVIRFLLMITPVAFFAILSHCIHPVRSGAMTSAILASRKTSGGRELGSERQEM
jgi:hypothetical protein